MVWKLYGAFLEVEWILIFKNDCMFPSELKITIINYFLTISRRRRGDYKPIFIEPKAKRI